MFILDVLTRESVPAFPEIERQRDLLVRPIHMMSEMSLNLAGDGKMELPADRRIDSAYGEYGGYYFREGSRVVYRRLLRLNPVRVSPAEYPAFRRFLQEVAKAERTAVIFQRTGK